MLLPKSVAADKVAANHNAAVHLVYDLVVKKNTTSALIATMSEPTRLQQLQRLQLELL